MALANSRSISCAISNEVGFFSMIDVFGSFRDLFDVVPLSFGVERPCRELVSGPVADVTSEFLDIW